MAHLLPALLITALLATTACSAERLAPPVQAKPQAPIDIVLHQDGAAGENQRLALRLEISSALELEQVRLRVRPERGLELPEPPRAAQAALPAGEILELAFQVALTADYGILIVSVSAEGPEGPLGRVARLACGDPPADWERPAAPVAEDAEGRPREDASSIPARVRPAP